MSLFQTEAGVRYWRIAELSRWVGQGALRLSCIAKKGGRIVKIRVALRMRPGRIVVGEMRDGAATVETLRSWNTGHPGGLCTLHANSADDALRRVEDLACEVLAAPPRRTIGQAVDLIANIRRTDLGRRLEAVIAVRGVSEEGCEVVPLA